MIAECKMSYADFERLLATRTNPPVPVKPNFWKVKDFPCPENREAPAHWVWQELTGDGGERCDVCQCCGYMDIRYTHTVYGTFRFPEGVRRVKLENVGSDCADSLTGSRAASNAEARDRSAKRAREKQIEAIVSDSSRWKMSKAGTLLCVREGNKVAGVGPSWSESGSFRACACIDGEWVNDPKQYSEWAAALRAAVSLILPKGRNSK